MYAIDDGGLAIASPAAVQRHIQEQLPGDHTVGTISKWEDSFLASLGVFRVIDKRVSGDEFQVEGPTTLVKVGDKVECRSDPVTIKLDAAKQFIRNVLMEKYREVLYGGVTIDSRLFRTDQDALNIYNSYQSALTAGTAFPGSGVPVILMDGTKVKLNATKWNSLIKNVALHGLTATNHWDSVDDSIEAAEEVASFRFILNNLHDEFKTDVKQKYADLSSVSTPEATT